MRPGISDDLQKIDDLRKTAVIDNELLRLNIDIAALQETRLPEFGSLKEKNFTFFWKGKSNQDVREHGVDFAVRNSLLNAVEPPSGGSERILTMRLNYSNGPVNLLFIYAPTLQASTETKDQFYEDLDSVISKLPQTEQLYYFLGDFSARVSSNHHSSPNIVSHQGIGKMNDNGQRLLELCSFHKLCVTNTYFTNKDCHKVSWRHPRSNH